MIAIGQSVFQVKNAFECRAFQFWAVCGTWHNDETNLRCAGISGICMPNPSIATLIVSEITAFIRKGRPKDTATSTRVVMLIKNIYTLWGRKRFLLPVTYFQTNLVYPFTLRVTGIKIVRVQ